MATKKGVGVLVISSLAFLIAIIIFFNSSKIMPSGGNVKLLGGLEHKISEGYYNAEKELLYIDIIANQALKEINGNSKNLSQKECLDNFKKIFAVKLKRYNELYSRNLTIDDFVFKLKDGQILGLSEKGLKLSKNNIVYSFKPNFKTTYRINCSNHQIE